MYRESQHYLALIRFPTLWGLLYVLGMVDPRLEQHSTLIRAQKSASTWRGTAEDGKPKARVQEVRNTTHTSNDSAETISWHTKQSPRMIQRLLRGDRNHQQNQQKNLPPTSTMDKITFNTAIRLSMLTDGALMTSGQPMRPASVHSHT